MEALEQIPSYAKWMKELDTRKREQREKEVGFFCQGTKIERIGQEACKLRMLAYHYNHHKDLDFIGSWRKKVEKKEVDYRPRYDPKGQDVVNTEELEGLHKPAIYRGVVAIFFGRSPLTMIDPTNDEQVRVNCNLSLDNNGEDFEMGGCLCLADTQD
ncbi:hypothetical protein HAX54_028643 [Datura stramonium]|uniref:Uncharacterized protein n=1 Tax=Datura stramonium TaxID=4076 RepID=A0ABS8V4V8_DATST|nr:hypothetical protein [Datura stramonium]